MIREWRRVKKVISIPGRIDRCALDKIELVLRAWRPVIGGRCSSVGSRLSTKQTYVYIGDADSATPASKYSPPRFSSRNVAERICEPRTKRAPQLDSSTRESHARFFFTRLAVIFIIFLLSHLILIFLRILPYFFLFPQRSFRYFHNRLSPLRVFLSRWRDGRPLLRRRNVPIKSESHVLPISRQLNLVHAHIAAAIAVTQALCQRTSPANSADRRTLDEYSMPSS